ncbi:MAG: hypothetical protein ACRC62_38905 [Microcoleus sp.]
MTGSKICFKYEADNGEEYHFEGDESNIKAVNGALAATTVDPSAYLIPGLISKMRLARYRSADGVITRSIPILKKTTVPAATISVRRSSGAGDDAGAAVTLTLKRVRPERFSLAYGEADDSGQQN